MAAKIRRDKKTFYITSTKKSNYMANKIIIKETKKNNNHHGQSQTTQVEQHGPLTTGE